MSSRRIFGLSILVYGLIITSFWTLDNGMLILAIPLVIYLGAVIIYRPQAVDLLIQRKFSTDFSKPGDEIEVLMTITNQGPNLDEVRVSDSLPFGMLLIDNKPDVVISLVKGASYSYHYTVSGQRGIYEFNDVLVQAVDHFGLFSKERRYNIPKTLTILPDFERIRIVPIRPLRTRGFAGSIPSRKAGSGTAFFGVREYQPGDPRQILNWRLSARTPDKLFWMHVNGQT